MDKKTYPKNAFQFLATAGITAEAETNERTLTGIAYAGGLVTDHGYWNNLVIDLASLTVATPIPLLLGHDQEGTVGIVTTATTAGNLSIAATLFADIDAAAAMVAAKADKGFPWQLSVGIWPSSVEDVPSGSSVSVNHQTFAGPVTIFRGGRVREVSVVALGADRNTSATVLGAGDQFDIPLITHEDNTVTIEALQAQLAELEAENAQLKAQNTELSAQTPDPAKFAPVTALSAMQTELAALQAKDQAREIDDLVKPALLVGKLLPAQESWARELGQSNLAALQQFIATAQPIAALAGTQTGGKAPDGGAHASGANAATTLAAAATRYQSEQAALGISIDDIAAIQHVSQGA